MILPSSDGHQEFGSLSENACGMLVVHLKKPGIKTKTPRSKAIS